MLQACDALANIHMAFLHSFSSCTHLDVITPSFFIHLYLSVSIFSHLALYLDANNVIQCLALLKATQLSLTLNLTTVAKLDLFVN